MGASSPVTDAALSAGGSPGMLKTKVAPGRASVPATRRARRGAPSLIIPGRVSGIDFEHSLLTKLYAGAVLYFLRSSGETVYYLPAGPPVGSTRSDAKGESCRRAGA